jgi:nucleoside-diphosphate-sugar epimerase
LGEYLVRDLLRRDVRLALVVRPGRKATVSERVEQIVQMWESQLDEVLPRPVVLQGDVAEPNLGLDQQAQSWVRRHCNRVFHNAATLTFHGSDRNAEPWRTNFTGTKNVLALCRAVGIDDLHYVSTAYVCGLPRAGKLVMEDELDTAQEFRNDYERAKFEAEQLVRADDSIKQLTVYRPGIIVGDSETGYMATYHGLGMYLKLMSVMIWNLDPDENGVRHTPLHLPCTGDEPRNPVTVDWTSEVMCRLFMNPEAHGGTYHVTPDTSMTAKQLIDYTGTYFNCAGVIYGAEEIGVNEFDKVSHDHLSIYHDYLTTDPQFDRTNLLKFVPDAPSPIVDEAMVHRFLQFGDTDRWGKRRRPKAVVPFQTVELMRELGEQRPDINGDQPDRTIGLDVVGPGGGQFRVVLSGEKIFAIEPGLPSQMSPVFRVTTDELGDAIGLKYDDGQLGELQHRVLCHRLVDYLNDAVSGISDLEEHTDGDALATPGLSAN